MSSETPSAETVGAIWEDENGRRWVQIGYSAIPTVTFAADDGMPARLTCVEGSPLAESMRLASD